MVLAAGDLRLSIKAVEAPTMKQERQDDIEFLVPPGLEEAQVHHLGQLEGIADGRFYHKRNSRFVSTKPPDCRW